MIPEQHSGLRKGAELEQSIAEHPFFHGLSSPRLRDFIQGAEEVAFEKNAVLFREGDPANRFLLIKEGEVALEGHGPGNRPLPIQTIGPNDVLGWSWLVAPFQWHFTARATKRTVAIALDGAHLLVACEKDPAFGYDLLKRILRIVLERLQATRHRLAEAALDEG